jgi:hypothetical protein
MIKVKEKFDKCNKENLTEFCDVLDMPVTNANTRKVCWFNSVNANILLLFFEFYINIGSNSTVIR